MRATQDRSGPEALTRPKAESESFESALARVASSTILVSVVDLHGRRSQGSGVLVDRDGRRGWIVTAAHVVDGIEDPGAEARAVFASGTPAQRVLEATLVAEDDWLYDLAFLRVEGDDLPAPVELSPAEPSLASPVHVLGFPFGDELGGRVAVVRGAVSRLDVDKAERFLIDAETHPGNSGGPVVDDRARLLGVVCAKVSGTGLSLASMASAVRACLAGRVQSHGVEANRTRTDQMRWSSKAGLVDPLERVEQVSLLFSRQPLSVTLPAPPYTAPAFPDMIERPLAREGLMRAHGDFDLPDPSPDAYVVQVKVARKDGTVTFMPPAVASPGATGHRGPPRPGTPRHVAATLGAHGFVNARALMVISPGNAQEVRSGLSSNGPFVVAHELRDAARGQRQSVYALWLVRAGAYECLSTLPDDSQLLGFVEVLGEPGLPRLQYYDDYPDGPVLGHVVFMPGFEHVIERRGVHAEIDQDLLLRGRRQDPTAFLHSASNLFLGRRPGTVDRVASPR